MAKIKETLRPKPTWNTDAKSYIAGQASIDGADATAIAMEQKWGAGRLRLLVANDLREKFDRQRFLYNAAIWHGDLEQLRAEAARMVKAYVALNAAAEAACALELDPRVWETALSDGTAVAIVRSHEDAHAVVRENRQMVVYTLEELAHMLERYQEVTKVKDVWPGAKVTQIRQSIPDPLDRIRDGTSLDDPMDDDLADIGL
jgi:hypothetical protein